MESFCHYIEIVSKHYKLVILARHGSIKYKCMHFVEYQKLSNSYVYLIIKMFMLAFYQKSSGLTQPDDQFLDPICTGMDLVIFSVSFFMKLCDSGHVLAF